ncbi:UDP-4-amino-4-deoxy-L-arabinose--oxoglutarate aminotransferase [hydrothermal vent metagenome]|uniref:UDP-4-amino-4-deoxy-L-arabinose--oxoglutarate aminotransferase n=1 Tax=hydrothermal vent metagenome TaxID=652676 RepID=A0A3B1E5X9_9ZZZZ
MNKKIPFYKPSVDNKELEQINQVLQNKSNKVEELENELAEYIGVPYAIATCNETVALHLALSAMELKRADKILMSVNTSPSLPEVVRHFDAEPIFIDIQNDGFNIDLNKLEEYLKQNDSKKLKGAIISFVAGVIPNLDKLYEIKNKYNIMLIEDATLALGSMYKNKLIGSLEADMTIFSTNHEKGKSPLNNNGFILTSNETLFTKGKLLRTHALTKSYDDKVGYMYDVVDIGYKYDITNLEAAFALAQFYKTTDFCDRRLEIATIYNKKLSDLKHIILPKFDEDQIFSQYIIKISKNRDGFARALKDKGVSTEVDYVPLHLLSYYKQKYKLKITKYPNALNTYGQILSLPIYPSLQDSEIEYICKSIIEIANDWI